MKRIIYVLVCLCVHSLHRSASAKSSGKETVKSQDDAFSWLNKYGYNPCATSGALCSLSLPSILKDYQKRFGLKVTGTLDEPTKKLMNRPRCGNHDKPVAELNKVAKFSQFIWSRSSLTYSIRNHPTQISEKNTAAIIRDAFNAWLAYIPLKIEPTCSTCSADFKIDFARGDHYDTYSFDGVGGTLAHAFFPEDGRVHFDEDEMWTERFDDAKTNLFLVAVHEIGHALGVDHTYNDKSIMYPSYKSMAKSDILPQTDRDTIQAMYGKKQSSSVTTATTRSTAKKSATTTTTTKSSVTVPNGRSHPRCRQFLDAAFGHPDGTLHTLNNGVIWRFLPKEKIWEERTTTFQEVYLHLPGQVVAAAYDSQTRQIVLFANTHVYHYDVSKSNAVTHRGEDRLPRNLQNSIVGAIYYKGELHVITSKTIRLFRLHAHSQVASERSLTEAFPNLPEKVETAFSNGHLHHFFTKDRLVYVWNEQSSSWQTFGKPMETSWLACSNTVKHMTQNSQTDKTRHRNSPGRHRHHHHHHHDY